MPGGVAAGAWPPARPLARAGGRWLRKVGIAGAVVCATRAWPRRGAARARATAVGAALFALGGVCSALAADQPAQPPAATTAQIAASLHPDRPAARGMLDIGITYGGTDGALPQPLRRAVLRLPGALGVDIPILRSCSPARLRTRGEAGCPPQSLIGRGQASVQALLGSQLLGERVALSLFVGPLVNLQPTFEILIQGDTPFRERVVVSGRVTPDQPPFGEDLAISLPPIPTLPLEPDATIVSLSLAIGTPASARSRRANAVVAPAHCPAGDLPLAIDSTFADGTSTSAVASVPCPR